MLKNIIFLIASMAVFSACSRTDDLTHQSPFDKAVGKSFVLQKDCPLVYYPLVQGYGENQKVIKDRYEIVCKSVLPGMKPMGNLKKGQIVKIIKIEREVTADNMYPPDFHVSLLNQTDEQKSGPNNLETIYSDMYTGTLINVSMSNTETFGDPPIFATEYLKPVASDGVWWK